MSHKPEDAATEEIILPENLVSLGSVLEEGITPLDVNMVLAKVFRVQHAEVAEVQAVVQQGPGPGNGDA